jgi:hypothetical protein
MGATANEVSMREYRVIDCRSTVITPEHKISAASPEQAVADALGLKVMRGGLSRNLVARVYWSEGGLTNMVRLYVPQP